jgi:GNAT superfamily N-acetyltransferase
MSTNSVRPGCDQDSAEIARLASQLGYPASASTIRYRLDRLLKSPSDAVFVAESGDGPLAGWIHGTLSQFLESDYRLEIAGLVVDELWQRRGIGRALVSRVEEWAVGHGVEQASVRCRTTRAEAHQFYQSLGYTPTKTQIVFRKPLPRRREPGAEAKSSVKTI